MVTPLQPTNGFRLDRTVSVRLVHPVIRMLDRKLRTRIPILMYHGIRDGVGTKHPYFETNTSPQLLCSDIQGQTRVVITFDDGCRDFYTHAFPILAKYGLKATIFIVTGRTGNGPIRRDNCEFMTWAEGREVCRHGIEIGSHTVSHPDLYALTERQVEEELAVSKRTIEDNLGEPVRSFAYPFAFPEHDEKFTVMLRKLLERNGYQSGVSTIVGTASREHDRFVLPRVPVNSYDDLSLYRAKLEGGYDWLHNPQSLYKAFKGLCTKTRGAH